jgi:hypothetical protein
MAFDAVNLARTYAVNRDIARQGPPNTEEDFYLRGPGRSCPPRQQAADTENKPESEAISLAPNKKLKAEGGRKYSSYYCIRDLGI